MGNLVTAKNLCLAYPAPSQGIRNLLSKPEPMPLALNNINFTLDPGERLALVGLNGSGKSTLLRTIAGIYPPKSGSLTVNGSVVALFNMGVGMRMDLSGRENIFLQGLAHGKNPKDMENIAPEVIDFSELSDVIDDPIRTYSQGMAMRLSFGIATALSPEVLLLDEWIGAGDRVFRAKADARLAKMVEESKGFILASHNVHIVRRYCTKAMWLDKGKVLADGDIETVLKAFTEATS